MPINHRKITQVLNWLAKKEGGSINKMKAIKLIWMADRLHLRKYGRSITNDDYIAMRLGPVGSMTRDITDQATQYLSDEQLGYARTYLSKTDDNYFKSIDDVDGSVLSKSDIEILEQVYEKLGKFNQFDLKDLSHEYPEWKKFKRILESGARKQMPMSYKDFFKDPDTSSTLLREKFAEAQIFNNQTKNTLETSKAAFIESEKLRELWS